jgi:DNA modification methylase
MKEEVIQGDCLIEMQKIPDKSIDMILTSPPYDNLRDYKGYTFDFEGIAKELYRVTKQGGVVVWVVGDATIKGSETGTSFKQALFFKEIGFNLHDTMIYQKQNPMPLNSNRYENCFEYMFVFSKGKPNIVNKILEPSKTAGTPNHGTYYKSDGTLVKKHGSGRLVKDNKVKSNIWIYPIGHNAKGLKHPATFPEKLAEDHILSWSNEGDTILDPMAGSGTTLKMAKKNNRNYIGIEISQEYIDIINKRLAPPQITLTSNK